MATSVLKVLISNPNITSTTTTRDFFPTSRHVALTRLINYLQQLVAGSDHGSGTTVQISELGGQTQATATVTCVTVANNSTVSFGGVTLTGKTGTPTGQSQFKCGVSATADAVALAACINGNTNLSPYMSAAAASGVVTVTTSNLGELGDLVGLTSSDGTNLAVVGFASGVDVSITTYQF